MHGRESQGFWREHAGSYPTRLSGPVRQRHLARIDSWVSHLHAWADERHTSLAIKPKPLGDPHPPDGERSALIVVGPARRKFVWKPGLDRFSVEKACQGIIALLGPESGLRELPGIEMAGGGAWLFIKERALPPLAADRVGRALAHLLLLAATFGIPDMHHENLLWDGDCFRLIDTECFSGPWTFEVSHSRRQLIADRIGRSLLIWGFLHKCPEMNLAEAAGHHLDQALARFRDSWSAMLSMRQAIAGRSARMLILPSEQMARLMPYAMDDQFKGLARLEFAAQVPNTIDHDEAFQALANGCIPLHHAPIMPVDHPLAGVIEPDETMVGVARALLRGLDCYHWDPAPSDPNQLLAEARVLDSARPEEPAEFHALPTFGNETEARWNHPGFCVGLGGVTYLHAAEIALGQPHSIHLSGEVFLSHARSVANAKPEPGAYQGSAGDYLLAWGLKRLGQLSSDLVSTLDDRVGYLWELKGPFTDLYHGRPGNLLGLARAASVLPWRRAELGAKGLELARQIEGEVMDILRDSTRWARSSKGFAHGLAGTAFALLEAQREFNWALPVTDLLLDALHGMVKVEFPDPKGPFCANWAGTLAVVAHAQNQQGWLMPMLDLKAASTDGCCGLAAYHLGRIAPLPLDLKPAGLCQGVAPFGYLGAAGLLTIKLAALGEIPDPLWGRQLLAPRP